MYKCLECGNEFGIPEFKKTCFEQEYGVSNLFNSRHDINIKICPSCKTDNIIELERCECCGEYCDELTDTEGMINGGIGYVCEQCLEDGDIR